MISITYNWTRALYFDISPVTVPVTAENLTVVAMLLS
jgi:hypothetical protein